MKINNGCKTVFQDAEKEIISPQTNKIIIGCSIAKTIAPTLKETLKLMEIKALYNIYGKMTHKIKKNRTKNIIFTIFVKTYVK